MKAIKSISFFLVLVMIFGAFVACNNNGNGDGTDSDTATGTNTTGGGYKLTLNIIIRNADGNVVYSKENYKYDSQSIQPTPNAVLEDYAFMDFDEGEVNVVFDETDSDRPLVSFGTASTSSSYLAIDGNTYTTFWLLKINGRDSNVHPNEYVLGQNNSDFDMSRTPVRVGDGSDAQTRIESEYITDNAGNKTITLEFYLAFTGSDKLTKATTAAVTTN